MSITARTATAADFDAAAQKHANATWFWGIAAAVAGYFWGWWWAALPAFLAVLAIARSLSATRLAGRLRSGGSVFANEPPAGSDADVEGDALLMKAQQLVNSYGQALDSVSGLEVANTSSLPAGKEVMKAALLLCIKLADTAQAREALKAGYVQLSTFQDGVGAIPDSELLSVSLREGEALLADLKSRGY